MTGRGAGSSLLRDTALLADCVSAMAAGVAGSGAVVTVKLRAGFDDTSRFDDNLAAALAAGAAFVTLHPRTRAQGYSGAADWDLVARAKRLAGGVPVVGNGDVTSAARALALLQRSACDGVMVGRGAATDPLIFRRIRAAFPGGAPAPAAEEEAGIIEAFVRRYYAELALVPPPKASRERGRTSAEAARFRMGKLKQLSNYLLRGNAAMAAPLAGLLRRGGEAASADTAGSEPLRVEAADAMAEDIVACVRQHWAGAPRDVLVDNFSSRTAYAGRTQRVLPLDAAGCGCSGEAGAAGAGDAAAVEEEEPEAEKTNGEVVERALVLRARRLAREAAWRARHAPRAAEGPPREAAPLR